MQAAKIILVGGCGSIGRKLKKEWPDAICVDRAKGADIICDLAALNERDSAFHSILKTADVVIHFATSADPEASELIHFSSVVHTAKLVAACATANVPNLILASSDWAEPKAAHLRINSYGYSKRVIEAMAEMYSICEYRVATAIRIGWIPDESVKIAEAPEWLLENHWNDAKLIGEFKKMIRKEPTAYDTKPPGSVRCAKRSANDDEKNS
ncbi:MAG: NAD-dependent epimerase/dehydratase family protein [Kiritimatiellae bacterium]|jgi:nucleoside-diphosphate-sugar epimerase|nr:NAD-dependent epimerase/dehydratase family protein [Kiritimatiellia bacterium]